MVGANVLNPFTNMAPVNFGSDTTLQIKFCAARASGTGTINLIASAADTALYRIFDMGAQL
jgi:hypothetical protein